MYDIKIFVAKATDTRPKNFLHKTKYISMINMQDEIIPSFYLVKNCLISYEGRAMAKGENETLGIVVKKDKAVICFDFDKGVKSKYYNASKELILDIDEDIFSLESTNKKGEKLSVKGTLINQVEISSYSGNEKQLIMKIGTEKDIVEWVKTNPDKFGLSEQDYKGAEVITHSGRIDILFTDTVIEVKKRAGARTFDQISRYLREINKKNGYIVCIQASTTLKEIVKKVEFIKIIELPEWQQIEGEIFKENY